MTEDLSEKYNDVIVGLLERTLTNCIADDVLKYSQAVLNLETARNWA
jgi:hypothetical protein